MAMPRRVPCASTKQARIRGGTCKRPETCRVAATVTMIGSAFEGSIRRTPNETTPALEQERCWREKPRRLKARDLPIPYRGL
jgi:hypothetical protein